MPPKQKNAKAVQQQQSVEELVDDVDNLSVASTTQVSAFECDCECGYHCAAKTEFAFNKIWDAHQLKCPSNINQKQQNNGPNFSNYIEIDGFSTSIPPTEVDLSEQRTFVCKYGCLTPTGVKKRFLTKHTFLDHIIKDHPKVRIVLESPPSMDGEHEGTRSILCDMDPEGK